MDSDFKINWLSKPFLFRCLLFLGYVLSVSCHSSQISFDPYTYREHLEEQGVDCDVDRDGYFSMRCGGDDCNDVNPHQHPRILDRTADQIDDNCDGVEDEGVCELGQLCPIRTVTTGQEHTCVLRSNGEVSCRGSEGTPQLWTLPPALRENVTDIDAGDYFTCVLQEGRIRCWGTEPDVETEGPHLPRDILDEDVLNQEDLAEEPSPFIDLCAGRSFVCGLDEEGDIRCQGREGSAIVQVPPLDNDHRYASLSCGHSHACALSEWGELKCWGTSVIGGDDIPQISQRDPDHPMRFTSVTAGYGSTCATSYEGRVACAGRFQFDHVPGDPVPENSLLEEGEHYTKVQYGNHRTCGLTTHSRILCGWSSPNEDEQVPDLEQGEVFIGLEVGLYHACGWTNASRALCWGNIHHGKTAVPRDQLEDDEHFTKVSTGFRHTCGLTSEGRVLCWGNLEETRQVPELNPEESYVDVDSAYEYACAATSEGRLICWGLYFYEHPFSGNRYVSHVRNRSLQLENGERITAVYVSSDYSFASTDSGDGDYIGWRSAFDEPSYYRISESCEEHRNDEIRCSPPNNAPTFEDNLPELEPGDSYIQISETEWRYCGLSERGRINCFRDQWTEMVEELDPQTERYIHLAVGTDHFCAITSLNRTLCWGDNSKGQLFVTPLNNEHFVSLSVYGHACGITNLNRLYCWGPDGSQGSQAP